jgi:hypothetical protein
MHVTFWQELIESKNEITVPIKQDLHAIDHIITSNTTGGTKAEIQLSL